MINAGSVISYLEMCHEEGVNLQRGMNFRLRNGLSVILMSLRIGAPYDDEYLFGNVIIYEGHDCPRNNKDIDPKKTDQCLINPNGTLTQNGLFLNAAMAYKNKKSGPELVKVYEKIKPGIWTYNGIFKLLDAWEDRTRERSVFKFKLELTEELPATKFEQLDHNRIIPSSVKLAVWKRDGGKCRICGLKDNLHFDHIIPYSKGGSSLTATNIQLLCVRHNLAKRNKIE